MSAEFRQQKSAMDVVGRLAANTRQPLAAMIEIADRCNETCLHCYQVQGQKGEMTTEEIFGLLDELAEQGVLFLTVSGGEATLRKDFLDIVAYARKKKFAVKIYTNGLRVTREMAQTLADLAVQEVQISLYSPRGEIHDEVTCVPGSFFKTTQAARWLVGAGVRVVLKTPLMKFNAGDHEAYIALCESIGADYMFDPMMLAREDGDRSPMALAMPEEESRKVLVDPRVMTPVPLDEVTSEHDVQRSVCGACRGSSIHVEANGELRPCGALTLKMGNVVEQGLAGAIAGTSESRFIGALTWADLHGCRRCSLRAHCRRCYETARSEGDALGPYRSACQNALLKWSLLNDAPAAVEGPHEGLGPYARTPNGFRVVPYSLSDDDLEKRREHPWITERAASVAPAKELVQIRRSERGDTLKQPAAALDA